MRKYLFYSVFIHLFLIYALFLSLMELGYFSFDKNGESDYTHVSVYKNPVNTDSPKSSVNHGNRLPLQTANRQLSIKNTEPVLSVSQELVSKNKYKITKNSSKISIEQDKKNYNLLRKETGDKTNKKSVQGGNENNEADKIKSSAKPEYGANRKPEYPLVARRRGYEGEVVFNVQVLNDGNVGDMQLLKTSGYTVLDNSAHNALKKWKFVPGKFKGKYVPSWVKVPILFRLNDI
jgi:TonB family protein